jgi:hypothetical protein
MASQSATLGAGDLDPSTTCADKEAYANMRKRDAAKSDGAYPDQSATKVTLLLISAFLSMFLVALDRTIISTV